MLRGLSRLQIGSKLVSKIAPMAKSTSSHHSFGPRSANDAIVARRSSSQAGTSPNDAGSADPATVKDFLEPGEFFQAVQRSGVDFFCGVPDSLLKDFCAYVSANAPSDTHVITANEGAAVALASGYHMASGKAAMVYLQNSGLGNVVNPLLSLASPEVYAVPMLLLIGWRGEPGVKDEPQHGVQGAVTPAMLEAMNVPYAILPASQAGAEQVLQQAKEHMASVGGPFAILVKRQVFAAYKPPAGTPVGFPDLPLTREDALKVVVDALPTEDCVVGTTGMLSRELFEHRAAKKETHARDFLTVGSMGHAGAIALGIAMANKKKHVVCLDGDGAVLMHTGTMSTMARYAAGNLTHVVVNNGAHDSVGGQPTDAGQEGFSFAKIAEGFGYKAWASATTADEIVAELAKLRANVNGVSLLEIKVKRGSRKNLGRPTTTPLENKAEFMKFLRS